MARPKARIDWNDVGEMLKCGCDTTSIAATLGISPDTLYVRSKKDNKLDFSAFSQQKKAQGADLLRRKQFELAMSGNVPMLIWLGKNRLGQAERQEIKTQKVGASEANKDSQLSSYAQHALRVYEVMRLEPLGISFDAENPDHVNGLKKELGSMIEIEKRLYPNELEIADAWEERFERLKPF